MAFVNEKIKEVQIKIVYYGAGRGGKTTSLEYIHGKYTEGAKGDLIELKTPEERTLFFDFCSLNIGKVRGYDLRIQIYTVPGQKRLDAVRKLVLRGADGIIFVLDAMAVQKNNNISSFHNLKEDLAIYDKSISDIPFSVQYNKIDLEKEGIVLSPLEELIDELSVDKKDARLLKLAPRIRTSATLGVNVIKALRASIMQVVESNLDIFEGLK
ncbi:MAG: gliding motility protein [Desulfobacterales bacterium]|nr:gliding motility protein [Desulfobacterales bacterium]